MKQINAITLVLVASIFSFMCISAIQPPIQQQVLVAQTTTSMVNQVNTWKKLGYHIVSVTSQSVSVSINEMYNYGSGDVHSSRMREIRGDIIIIMEK